jgi:NAD(P)-dependent dehydrogenase (short-subunit alcohol dehydrogenase family)
MQQLSGRTVLITGAVGGLGSCMARHFREAGAHVIATDLRAGEGLVPHDVTSEADWVRVFADAARAGHPIDVLVNNAGWYQPNIELREMSLDTWRRHFAINTDGAFLGVREALRAMHGRGGVILNICSGAAVTPFAQGGAYCASKAATLMLTRVAAKAGGPQGIRVNAILPGAVPTDMLRGNLLPGQDEQQYLAMLASFSPLNRLASPDDVALAAVFLCSDAAAAISGVALPVDAGAVG